MKHDINDDFETFIYADWLNDEVKVTVEVRGYNGSGSPDDPDEIEIESVETEDGEDVLDKLSEEQIDELKEEAQKQLDL